MNMRTEARLIRRGGRGRGELTLPNPIKQSMAEQCLKDGGAVIDSMSVLAPNASFWMFRVGTIEDIWRQCSFWVSWQDQLPEDA